MLGRGRIAGQVRCVLPSSPVSEYGGSTGTFPPRAEETLLPAPRWIWTVARSDGGTMFGMTSDWNQNVVEVRLGKAMKWRRITL